MADHEHPSDSPGVRMAASVSFAHCAHGSIFLRLHDRDGEIYAAGCMDLTIALDALESLGAEIDAAVTLLKTGAAEPQPEVH